MRSSKETQVSAASLTSLLTSTYYTLLTQTEVSPVEYESICTEACHYLETTMEKRFDWLDQLTLGVSISSVHVKV